MSTDDQSTQGSDSQDHQNHEDTQNSQDHSDESKKEGNEFDARTAFNKQGEKINKLTEQVSKIDPEVIGEIAKRLGITKEEAKEEAEQAAETGEQPNVEDVVRQTLWKENNASRIETANKDGNYDKYLQQGLAPDYALRLAEQDMGIQVDTSKADSQRKAPKNASVDRDTAPRMPDSLKGTMTQEEFDKYHDKAQKVQVIK